MRNGGLYRKAIDFLIKKEFKERERGNTPALFLEELTQLFGIKIEQARNMAYYMIRNGWIEVEGSCVSSGFPKKYRVSKFILEGVWAAPQYKKKVNTEPAPAKDFMVLDMRPDYGCDDIDITGGTTRRAAIRKDAIAIIKEISADECMVVTASEIVNAANSFDEIMDNLN